MIHLHLRLWNWACIVHTLAHPHPNPLSNPFYSYLFSWSSDLDPDHPRFMFPLYSATYIVNVQTCQLRPPLLLKRPPSPSLFPSQIFSNMTIYFFSKLMYTYSWKLKISPMILKIFFFLFHAGPLFSLCELSSLSLEWLIQLCICM